MKTIIMLCMVILGIVTARASGGDRRHSVGITAFQTRITSTTYVGGGGAYSVCTTITVPSPTDVAIQEETYRQIMETYRANREQRQFWNNVWCVLILLLASILMSVPAWIRERAMNRCEPRTG